MLEKHHRRSHLTPQNPTDTKALLRSVTPQPTPFSSILTPSSGDILIGNLSLDSSLQTPPSSGSTYQSASSDRPWPTRTSSAARNVLSPPPSADRSRYPTTSGPLPPLPRKPVSNGSLAVGSVEAPKSGGSYQRSPDERRF